MADEQKTQPAATVPTFAEGDKARARQWFKKAADCRERREYDYAIECLITGLTFWPEAVEEGHMPLRALAFQRMQAGGKKPSVMEGFKRPLTGKDARAAMLNAEYLLAKDPTSPTYVDAVLKNAAKALLPEATKFAAPLVMESLRKDKKPSAARFKAYRQALVELGEKVEASDVKTAVQMYEWGVASLEYQLARGPDEALRQEQRHLSGKLTIVRGNYAEAESFRDSLRDADKQKVLHDTDRAQQTEDSIGNLIESARKELAAHPNMPAKVFALVEALLRRERAVEEDEAVALLMQTYEQSKNYSLKSRADDVRLRQLNRRARHLIEAARTSGSDADKQAARHAAGELQQAELAAAVERVEQYPTDLRLKFKLGQVYFKIKRYDDAIPILQAAQSDPRSRGRCQLLIGRSFFEKHAYTQATAVLKDALETYDNPGDDVGKELTYWLGRAYEAAGDKPNAQATYGRLLRSDYNYADGDARKRHDALSAAPT